MINKIIWVLIIIWVIWTWYFFYNYKYLVKNEEEISSKIKKQEELEKQKFEDKKEIILTKQILNKDLLTNSEKIQKIKENNKNYKNFTFNNWLKVYFKEEDNKLDLYSDDKKIWTFDLVYPDYLKIYLIDWTLNDLYIEVANNKFYYNSVLWNIVQIDLNIDVIYSKKTQENNLIFVTSKWSFNYSITEKTLEYFSYFNDYVSFNDWYIWLVKKDEKRILNNLWFEATWNLIVYYNPNTKEKNIIYKTDLDINKIYTIENKLFLVKDDWEIYELENI